VPGEVCALIDSQIRNNIRYAVEVCSIQRMKRSLPSLLSLVTSRSSMEERNKLLRIYGPELCAEEASAVANMMRMFSLSPMYDEDEGDEAPEVHLLSVSLSTTASSH
jgi:hypothetical protein